MFINWVNFADLTSEELKRGLVIGPVPKFMWIILLVFTVVGTVLFVPETLNTLSVFFCDGETKVPLIWEQLVILPLEQIPLAAINYFISRCRQQYATTIQTLCGTISIVFIFVRIVWYAHMEGKVLQRKDDVKMKKGLFMAVCALYACSLAFPIMSWRFQPETDMNAEFVDHVSIFLLKAPFLETRVITKYPLDDVLRSQGRNLHSPELVKSVTTIYKSEDEGLIAEYKCDSNATFLPPECAGRNGRLIFRFIYEPYTEAGPFGEVLYNFAFEHIESDTNTTWCEASSGDLSHNWRLFYFKSVQKRDKQSLHVYVSSPWEGTCTTPQPWYAASIQVCDTEPAIHAHPDQSNSSFTRSSSRSMLKPGS